MKSESIAFTSQQRNGGIFSTHCLSAAISCRRRVDEVMIKLQK